ncbi:MAG: transposase [Marinicellaceae bacterium]
MKQKEIEKLGYPKSQKSKNKNSRNGSTKKKIKNNGGAIEVATPRDR